MKYLITLIALVSTAAAQAQVWGQCGGIGYNGPKTCVSGTSCLYLNDYYSQCQPGSSTTGSTTMTLRTITRSSSSTRTTTTRTISTTKTTSTKKSSSTTKSSSTKKSSSTTKSISITKTSISATKTSTSSTSGIASPSGSLVHYVGRVNPATKELTWPSTGLAFTFVGTKASIGIASLWGTISITLWIDGTPTVIPSVSGTSISIGPLQSGTHTVVLRKRSEAYFGSIYLGDVTTDGTLINSTRPGRRIEIIGDSISVGYGLDGVNPCTNSAEVENNPLTYGPLAADSLNADYSVVAWSGKGIIRNYPSTPPDTSAYMPQLYSRYGANDADNSYNFPSSWIPDAIVINLGTNDFGYLGWDANGNSYEARSRINITEYTTALVDFSKSIQSHYPAAHFFFMSSPLLGDSYPAGDSQKTVQIAALEDVVSELGSKAHFVDWPTQGADSGCDYHPNAATNAAEAPVLAAAIKSALGW